MEMKLFTSEILMASFLEQSSPTWMTSIWPAQMSFSLIEEEFNVSKIEKDVFRFTGLDIKVVDGSISPKEF